MQTPKMRILNPTRTSRILLASTKRLGWICSSCRAASIGRRSNSMLANGQDSKPYYITSPIFYVNAAPHVGHLYTMVLTDILKRYQSLRSRRAILLTGTDEHGLKIQQAAYKARSDIKPFCDTGAAVFQSLAQRASISHDRFIRTTDADHVEAVQYAWLMLRERGHIYTSKHEGWYSVSDETFYPQSAVQLILDPATGRKMMTSMETGKEVEWTSETNYHFRMSSFRDQLLQYYHDNPSFITPQSRMNDVVRAVEEGLEDLSISRPVERLQWGVRVPDDPSQTIYVWLDALINYITAAGYPWSPTNASSGGWPADVQVIGKDIIRFHAIYWPTLLMALDVPPPKRLLTHAHWTLGKAKMAKSTGNVVNPFFALDRFGVDIMRFYLAHDGGIQDDADYNNFSIIERYKKCLQHSLGGLASRILRGKGWSVSSIVKTSPLSSNAIQESRRAENHQAMLDTLTSLPSTFAAQMDALNPGAALKTIMDTIYKANSYLHTTSPWLAVKLEWDKDGVEIPVYLAAESLRITGILLQPYMPGKAALLLDMLGVDEARRTFEFAHPGKDGEYGVSKVDLGKGHKGALFPPLASEEH